MFCVDLDDSVSVKSPRLQVAKLILEEYEFMQQKLG